MSDGTRPRIIPPDILPLWSYWSPIWLPDGTHIGFNHVPLISATYDPRTGHVTYDFVDSLAGWWITEYRGAADSLRRIIPMFLEGADANSSVGKLTFSTGNRLFTVSLNGVTPDLASMVEVPTPNQATAPRWNAPGDSLVYFGIDDPRGTWITHAQGGGAHIVYPYLLAPDWHPSARRIAGVVSRSTGSARESKILEYNLDTGDSTTLLSSSTTRFGTPRYSPDGSHIAYTAFPVGGGDQSLWVANADGTNQRVLRTSNVFGYDWHPAGIAIVYIDFDPSDYSVNNGTAWVIDVLTGDRYHLAGNTIPP